MGVLLGITGAIDSGKTTFAEYLTNASASHAHYESGRVIADIATAFNKALKAELGFETATNDIELTNQVLIWLPDAISEYLHHDVIWNQLVVTKHDTLLHPERYDKLFVYLNTIRHDPSLLNVALSDATKKRFRPLLQWLGNYLIVKVSKTIWYDEIFRRIDQHDATTSLIVIGGLRYQSDAAVVRAHGGKIIAIERPGLARAQTDVTEKARSFIEPDITIVNNGSLTELQMIAETFWNDLQSDRQVKYYSAKPVSA